MLVKTAQIILTVWIEGRIETAAMALDPTEPHTTILPVYAGDHKPGDKHVAQARVEYRPEGRST